jgi:hypothetical protein
MDMNFYLEPRRSESPDHYSDNDSTRSQTPRGSFYHGAPSAHVTAVDDNSTCFSSTITAHKRMREALECQEEEEAAEMAARQATRLDENKRIMERTMEAMHTPPYQYKTILPTEIRLLRLSPRRLQSSLFLALKIMPLEKVLKENFEFQALSYAWGNDTLECIVQLGDITRPSEALNAADPIADSKGSTKYRAFSIRQNLYYALQRIRLLDRYSWIWVDAICINQSDDNEKSQQIPKMPDIY